MQLSIFIQEIRILTVVFFFPFFIFLCNVISIVTCFAFVPSKRPEVAYAPSSISLSYQSASKVDIICGTKGSEGNLFSA